MQKFFFSGSNDAKLDEKNRFVLPQNMRFGLIDEGKLEFTIGLGLGGCLVIYKNEDIEKIIKKFKANLYNAKYQKFFTLFFSLLHPTTCDKIGRVSLPVRLKEAAGIKKEIVIAGVLDKIEIWPKEKYDQSLTTLLSGKDEKFNLNNMTEEAFALLSESESHE